MPSHAGGEFDEVVVAGEEVDFALGVGDAAQGLHPVVGVAEELQDGSKDGGVVDAGQVVVGGVGVVGTVHPFPFAQSSGGLLNLPFDSKVPGAEGGVAHQFELGVVDGHVKSVAGMFEECAHSPVKLLGIGGVFAHAYGV